MALGHYVFSISSAWEYAVEIADVVERSTQAANSAFLRLIPDYEALKLPRGAKTALRALTKRAG